MSRAGEFLKTFFSLPNTLTYDAMVGNPSPAVANFMKWPLESINNADGFALLPRRSETVTTWYGLGFSDHAFLNMRDLLIAFVGPSFSSYHGASLPISQDDPIDASAYAYSAGRCLKFEVWPRGNEEHQRAVRAAIKLMYELRAATPTRVFRDVRPVWRVLRDVEFALDTGDIESAESILEELTSRHLLEEPNRTFLRIRISAAAEKWSEIVALPQFSILFDVPRPPLVTDAMIRAVYYSAIEPLIASHKSDSASQEMLPKYDKLFFADPPIIDEITTRAATFVSLASTPPRLEQAARMMAEASRRSTDLVKELTPFFGKKIFEEFETRPSATEEDSALAYAERCASAGDMQKVVDILRDTERSPERALLLIRAAISVQSLEASELAVEALTDLPEVGSSPQDSILAIWVKHLRSLAGEERDFPDDWIDWANRLVIRPNYSTAREVAERGASEWTNTDYSGIQLKALAETIRDVPDANAVYLTRSIPHILSCFPTEGANGEHLPLYLALLERIAFAGEITQQERECSLRLTEACLSLSPNSSVYVDLIDVLRIVWETIASPAAVDWAADMCQLLAYFPCPADQARQAFVGSITDRSYAWQKLFNSALRQALTAAREFVGLPDQGWTLPTGTPDQDDASVWSVLNGRTVAIHTLLESAAVQARKVIGRLAPDCVVVINTDHGNTPSLAALTKGADLFVLVTQSAKHAASIPIVSGRGQLPLVRPIGRGTTSILRAIEEWIRTGVD